MCLGVKFIYPSWDSLGHVNITVLFHQLLTIANNIVTLLFSLFSLSGILAKCILGSFYSILGWENYNTWPKSGLLLVS